MGLQNYKGAMAFDVKFVLMNDNVTIDQTENGTSLVILSLRYRKNM